MMLSVDIETFGKLSSHPRQTTFSPQRMHYVDGVHPRNAILTVSLTQILGDPDDLSTWEPGETMVADFRKPLHRMMLLEHFKKAPTILGMNFAFDLKCLRAHSPHLHLVLNGQQRIVDLSVIAYLENESRPERSLKNLGPVLGTHKYNEGDLGTLDTWDDLVRYNAEDTHNTILATAALARRIHNHRDQSAPTHYKDKLSPYCLNHYSDVIWSTVHMSESGVPFSRSKLERLATSLQNTITACESIATNINHDLLLAGKGSRASKDSFMQALLTEAHARNPDQSDAIDEHVILTPKSGQVSQSRPVREHLSKFIPPDSPLYRTTRLFDKHSRSQKLLGSYCYPLLHHRKNKPHIRNSVLTPLSSPQYNPDTWISTPSWFITPGPAKDGDGSSGGTEQGRITCKDAAHQTDPPIIQGCRQSRWPSGILIGFDLSQIELRVGGLLSGEPAILTEYSKSKPDLHSQMMATCFGEEAYNDPHYRKGGELDPRQWGKGINFLVLFRGGASKAQATLQAFSGLSFPLSRCEEIINNANRSRPILRSWQDEMIAEARTYKRVCLPFIGQSRHFAGGEKYDVNEIVNFPIQTTAGNVLLRLQHHVLQHIRRIPHIKMFLNVYDALYFDCRSISWAHTLIEILQQSLTEVATNDLWGMLESHTSNTCPLVGELTLNGEEHVLTG